MPGAPIAEEPSTLAPGLYLVGTPIGNLEDITLRALRILKEADVIACEDTRQSQKLLHHYTIKTKTVSYHEHNEMTRAAELVIDLERGARVALVADAGMPASLTPDFDSFLSPSATTYRSSPFPAHQHFCQHSSPAGFQPTLSASADSFPPRADNADNCSRASANRRGHKSSMKPRTGSLKPWKTSPPHWVPIVTW